MTVLILLMSLPALLAGETLGFSSSCSGSECLYSARTSVIAVLCSLSLICFVFLFPRKSITELTDKPAFMAQRTGAFFIDLLCASTIAVTISTLLILTIEAGHSGTFQWHFTREPGRPSDGLTAAIAVISGYLTLFVYNYVFGKASRQTPGQYIAGYAVRENPNSAYKTRHALRLLLWPIGALGWPFSLTTPIEQNQSDAGKEQWWDRQTGTYAVRVSFLPD
ncbi:MAG: RDD family protein [Aquisalinus sp.]|nr:RDD family protein [Aquisalinus sp.]